MLPIIVQRKSIAIWRLSRVPQTAILAARRSYVHAFFRLPPEESIPTHSRTGEEVDKTLFLNQVRGMFLALEQTQLIETLHEMKSLPYFESMFVGDLVASMKSMIFMMPKHGREHRISEMSETFRYIRGCGSNNDFNSTFQEARGALAHGGDFLATTQGMVLAWGTPRTNAIAKDCVNATEGNQVPLTMHCVEQKPDAPPLGDLVAFAGSRTLLAEDSDHARSAVAQIVSLQNKVPWQVSVVDKGCSVLSFPSGSLPVYDVLCDEDFPGTMDRMTELGLNPFPVHWTEPRKLGITMRSVTLIARFTFATGAGGFQHSINHRTSERRYTSAKTRPRIIHQHTASYGDQGAPLLAQLRSGQLPEPVYQPPPRYRAPMHAQNKEALATTTPCEP